MSLLLPAGTLILQDFPRSPMPTQEFEIVQTVTYGNEPPFDPNVDQFPKDVLGQFR
jgi:hypothetical protein